MNATPNAARLLTLAFPLLLAACTISSVYVPGAERRPSAVGVPVQVGAFDNQLNLGGDRRIWGPHSLDRPVSAVARDAVIAELKQAGYDVGKSGPTVEGAVLHFCERWYSADSPMSKLVFRIRAEFGGALLYERAITHRGDFAWSGYEDGPGVMRTFQGAVLEFMADEDAHAVLAAAAGRAAPPATIAAGSAPVPPPAPPSAPAPAQPPPGPLGPGDTYVLIVGVDAYADPKIPPLRFAEQDARALYAFYATERRSPTKADRVLLLLGEDASRKAILRGIREHLAMKATAPEDTVVLYFAGHGFADARGAYLAGHDAELGSLPETAISAAALQEAWGEVRARRKVLIADACRSGGLGNTRGVGGVALAPEPAAAGGGALASLTIAATGPNELSTEDPKLGQGVFTIALLKGLRGEADEDGDGRVAGDEIGRFLVREVPRVAAQVGGRQTPVVSTAPAPPGPPIFLTR